MRKLSKEDLQTRYKNARKNYLKMQDREFYSYMVDAVYKNRKAAAQNRRCSQKAY